MVFGSTEEQILLVRSFSSSSFTSILKRFSFQDLHYVSQPVHRVQLQCYSQYTYANMVGKRFNGQLEGWSQGLLGWAATPLIMEKFNPDTASLPAEGYRLQHFKLRARANRRAAIVFRRCWIRPLYSICNRKFKALCKYLRKSTVCPTLGKQSDLKRKIKVMVNYNNARPDAQLV